MNKEQRGRLLADKGDLANAIRAESGFANRTEEDANRAHGSAWRRWKSRCGTILRIFEKSSWRNGFPFA